MSLSHHVDDAHAKMTPEEVRLWLTAIAESADDAIVGKELRGVVISWNKAAETMFGYMAAEIIGRPITVIIPPDRIDEEAAILGRIRRGEKLAHFETARRRKDDLVIPVSLTISPIRNGEGRIIGVSKIARDLSEVQRARQELQRREALRRSILETVPDALIVIDERGIIQSFSTTAECLFGYQEPEMLDYLIHEHSRDSLADVV